ncbi:hypothetical protein FB451DRAFT_1368696 [Mycena latifolia]|nr:hypothetical protein FB451DRAFT_1368696 [Mycena latifolia]
MFRLFALLPILSAAGYPGSPLLPRQTSIADCTTICTNLSSAIAASGGGLAALCTSTIAAGYASCYGCEAQFGGMTVPEAQETVDAYVQTCDANGHSVAGITITGNGASGGAAAASGAASPPAASGASAPPTGKTGGSARAGAGLVGVTGAVVLVASFVGWW